MCLLEELAKLYTKKIFPVGSSVYIWIYFLVDWGFFSPNITYLKGSVGKIFIMDLVYDRKFSCQFEISAELGKKNHIP